MRFPFEPEDGETVLARDELDPRGTPPPIAFVVTDRALLLSTTNAFPVLYANRLRRFPLSEIRELRCRRMTPWLARAAAVLLIGFALTLFFLAYRNGVFPLFPFAPLVLGLLIGRYRGRFGLVVTTGDGTFRWKVPLATELSSRERVKEMITAIVEAARKVELPVVDERPGRPR